MPIWPGMAAQLSFLPEGTTPAPPGLALAIEAIPPETETALADRIDALPLEPFRFGQWTGKRLTCSFGSGYDYARGRVLEAPPMSEWLLPVRRRLAEAFGRDADGFVQALAIRYDPGAGIGWHRDRPQYGEIIGLSLSHPAVLRLRRRVGTGFERRSIELPPRSAYLLAGEVRDGWEHSIAPIEATRRSITFRTMRG